MWFGLQSIKQRIGIKTAQTGNQSATEQSRMMQYLWKVTHVTLWSACVQIGSLEVVIDITPRLFSCFRSSDRHQVLGSCRSSNGSSAMVAIVSSSSKDQHIRMVIHELIHLQNTGLKATLYTSTALAFYVLFLLLNLYLLETSQRQPSSSPYKQQSMPSAAYNTSRALAL